MQIRAAPASDAPACAAIYRPYVTDDVISFEEVAPDDTQMTERIAATLQAYPWLVAENAGGVLGYAYAGRHQQRAAYRWGADVTVYLAPAAYRQGVGRALYTHLFAILLRQNLRTAFAGIALPNAASVGLHEAMGFRPIGVQRRAGYKHGGWHDVGWWQLLLVDDESEPVEPIPYPQLSG